MNKQLFVRTYLCTLLFSPRFAHICCCVRNTRPSHAALLQCLALGSYFCCLCPPPSEPVGFLGCFRAFSSLTYGCCHKAQAKQPLL